MTVSTRPNPDQRSRRWPESVVVSWLVAGAVLIALAYYVVAHLASSDSSMTTGHSMTDTLFRGDAPATAHTLLGSRLFTAWQLNVPALALIAVLAAAYLSAVRLRRGRTESAWPVSNTVAFLGGLAVIGFATCGSIAVYDAALFSAHMLGHLALVMLAPALLVLGHPLRLATEAAAPDRAEKISTFSAGPMVSLLTSPPVALACYTAVIVGSHLTGLMNLIMEHTWAGQVEHLVYLVIGGQFFALILGDEPLRWRLSTPIRWVLLAVSMAVDTFTGVVLMMSTVAVAMHAPTGVGPLDDTKTGGAIMWFGGDAIMAAIMVGLAVRWLAAGGRSSRDRASWLEQARLQTLDERSELAAHRGSEAAPGLVRDPINEPDRDSIREPVRDLDDDDAEHAAYNAWLAKVAQRGH